jgi:hypothetical protein
VFRIKWKAVPFTVFNTGRRRWPHIDAKKGDYYAGQTRRPGHNGLQAGLEAAGIDPAVLLRKSGLPLTLWSSGRGMVSF